MTEEKEIVVTSIEGLYDEKIVEKLEQGICWFGKHRFVNYYKTRLCSNCQKVDHQHLWDTEIEYEIPQHKYYSEVWRVYHCSICNKRILNGGYGRGKSSPDIEPLIQEVSQELGFSQMYGGEFYTAVSYTMDNQGKEAAKNMIRQTFLSGRMSKSVMRLSDMQ